MVNKKPSEQRFIPTDYNKFAEIEIKASPEFKKMFGKYQKRIRREKNIVIETKNEIKEKPICFTPNKENELKCNGKRNMYNQVWVSCEQCTHLAKINNDERDRCFISIKIFGETI